MIRNLKIFLIVICILNLQQVYAAGEAAGDQHDNKESEHAGEENQTRKIHLTPKQKELLSIQTVEVSKGRAGAIVTAPAEIQYVPDRVAEVGPLLEGKLTGLAVDLGDRVKKGQLLATMDSMELARIRSRLMSLEARKEAAESAYNRERKLQEQGISSEEDFLDAKASYLEIKAEYNSIREQLEVFGGRSSGSNGSIVLYELRSPIKGRIERMDVRLGQTLNASDTPFTVADTSTVWVMLQVSEADISRVSVGDKVQVFSESVADRFHTGEVSWISNVLDEETRTVPVRVVLESPNGDLRPNTYAKTRIMTESGASLPLVPDDAVQTIGDESVVFVPGDEKGAYKAVPVVLGKEANGWIEIRSGISANTEVVSVGAFDLMSAITASGRSAAHGH
jgi:cobalt-zinc-cadmium efflux system membrane fusion protein